MIKKTKAKYKQHKETIDNFFWRSLQIGAKQGIIFLIFIFCAKLLSPYDFGIYNYALAIVFFLIIFGDFGISTATSKYVAEYNVTNKNKLKAVLFNSGIIILGLTIIISILTLIIGPWYLKDKYIYVLYLLPLIFLAPMTSLYDGIYRGLKRFKQLAIISTIVGLISIVFVYILIAKYGLIGALISQNIFYLVLLGGLALGYRDFNFKFDKGVMKEVSNYSFIFGLAFLGYYLFARIDILVLGYYGYIKEIAYYELLNKIFIVLLFPFTILGQVIAPNFTTFFAKGKYSTVYKKYIKYNFLFLLIGCALAVLSWAIIPIAIELILPKYFNNLMWEILPISIILFAISVWTSTIDGGIIVPVGYAKIMSLVYIPAGISALFISLSLIKNFGFMSVILTHLVIYAVSILILKIIYYKKLKKLTLNI